MSNSDNFTEIFNVYQDTNWWRNFYSQIDEKIEIFRECVAMIVQVTPGPRVCSFGSGFFYEFDGWPFFITARHVIEDMKQYLERGRPSAIITRGKKELIPIRNMEFFLDAEWDVAVCPLWKMSKSIYGHVKFLKRKDLAVLSEHSKHSLYVFTGFPAAKNKTYTGQEIKPEQRNITLDMKVENNTFDMNSPFLYFCFNPRKVHDSNFKKIAIPYPEGMSGGPIFDVTGQESKPILKIAGIGLSCITATNQLKSIRFDLVDAWLSNYNRW